VLTAVQRYDGFSFETRKIENAIPERMLPSELASFQLPIAQVLPQSVLGVGRGIA
jgi:hypothetical protein